MTVLVQSDVLMGALKVRCHETGKHTSRVANRADPTRVDTFVGRFVVQSHQLESLGFELKTEHPQDEVGLMVEIVSSMYDELKVVAVFDSDDGSIIQPHVQPLVSALLIEGGEWVWVENGEMIDKLILCILSAEVYTGG